MTLVVVKVAAHIGLSWFDPSRVRRCRAEDVSRPETKNIVIERCPVFEGCSFVASAASRCS